MSIILAEDHPIVRNGIRGALENEPDIIVVGEGRNGFEILEILSNGVEADILLADISMPDMDGIALLNHLKQNYPTLKVIILSMLDHEKYIYKAFELGAMGYLLKNVSIEELLFYIREVYLGHQIVCNEIAMAMLKRAASSGENVPPAILLNEREREILDMISEGFTNQQIADKIFVSRRTVEGHRQALIDKAGVKNTAQLIRFACKNGLM